MKLRKLFFIFIFIFATLFSLAVPILAQEKVDYYLPYPGILPDHFFYPIKMVRDRIWLFLTTDKLKRVELLLLFADKRLAAAKVLIEEGKLELGITTVTKAEKYLEQALAAEETVFPEKFSKAVLKHKEVLAQIKLKLNEEQKAVIDQILQKEFFP